MGAVVEFRVLGAGLQVEGVEHRLDLLAHHFWNSDDDERKRLYLQRAADAARSAYANDAAIRYLERLVPMLDGTERVEALLQLAKVVELAGDWARAQTTAREALDAALAWILEGA